MELKPGPPPGMATAAPAGSSHQLRAQRGSRACWARVHTRQRCLRINPLCLKSVPRLFQDFLIITRSPLVTPAADGYLSAHWDG
ncbi:uncharacterized protein LOC132248563 isoform X3 [Alligator mississippiensis]|uniref:uncharacterized protein LOC132248563 isoform X3 n=1 Tax=Alligator mississippiensis TaxID=8496 RepID=UPI002877A1C6|nr:uncharacterized protein LOC132248563 isoform X3 [Alligator mississippiensis]